MPKRVKKAAKKRLSPPKDVNQWARHMVDASTSEPDPSPALPRKPSLSKELLAYMSQLGRRGGVVSGARRMTNLSDQERGAIALKAARARWAKVAKKKRT